MLSGCNHTRIQYSRGKCSGTREENSDACAPSCSFIPAFSHSLNRCFMTAYFTEGTNGLLLLPERETLEFLALFLVSVTDSMGLS